MTTPVSEQPTDLSAQEAKVSNILALAWNEFCKLARDENGRRDFAASINAAQYLVLAGPGIRQLNAMNSVIEARQASQAEIEQALAAAGGDGQPNADD